MFLNYPTLILRFQNDGYIAKIKITGTYLNDKIITSYISIGNGK